MTYTGLAGRLLGTRHKKHRSAGRRHDTKSCLALHCMDTGHTFNCQDTRILKSANSKRAREAIEVLNSGDQSVNQFMLHVNAFTALINMPHPFSSPTLSTLPTYLPSPITSSHTLSHLCSPLPISPTNDVHLPFVTPPLFRGQ